MKVNMGESRIAAVCIMLIPFFSCRNMGGTQGRNDAQELFEQNPVTVTWENPGAGGNIESYEADVEVYSMNNRKDTALTLQNKYRMSMKTINGGQYVRIDMDPDYNQGSARSIVSGKEGTIVFNTQSGEIQYRLPAEENALPEDLVPFLSGNALTRMDVDGIRNECRKLSFDIQDKTDGEMLIQLPSALFPSDGYESRSSTSMLFDTADGTLVQTQVVCIESDGTEVKTDCYPVYEDKDGTPVKVGMVTEIISKAAQLLDNDETGVYYNSIDDIPEISDEEYERLTAEGNITQTDHVSFGNPADPGYTETIAELYQDVHINTVSDSQFKMLFEK
ncbi:MAG: hypothetical protein M0P01_12355 [Treponema sp.]|nr:hypothetical protein [Treponema sp.]